jgi:hypothetical protein
MGRSGGLGHVFLDGFHVEAGRFSHRREVDEALRQFRDYFLNENDAAAGLFSTYLAALPIPLRRVIGE